MQFGIPGDPNMRVIRTNFRRLGGPLGVPRGGFGVYSGMVGVLSCAFGAQSAQKAASPFHGPPLLEDFGEQRKPRRLPKWS